MIERLLLLLGLAALIAVGWLALRGWQARRLARLRAERPLAGMVAVGRPAVVAFSTPQCHECLWRQAPALQRLQVALGGTVDVQTLSALDHPSLVERLGILTVPATAVLDATGAIQTINLGYTDEQTLRAQLQALSVNG